jgi:hypothetical protein
MKNKNRVRNVLTRFEFAFGGCYFLQSANVNGFTFAASINVSGRCSWRRITWSGPCHPERREDQK